MPPSTTCEGGVCLSTQVLILSTGWLLTRTSRSAPVVIVICMKNSSLSVLSAKELIFNIRC